MADETTGKPGQGKVSGRMVVLVLFAGALLLWGIVFMVGLRQRASDRAEAAIESAVDSAAGPDSVRAWMRTLPQDWIKVTRVEGQGYVLYVPCYSSNGTLSLSVPPDSIPALSCEYCEDLDAHAVTGIVRNRRDSAWEFRLDPQVGRLRMLPVNDNLLRNFPEAPFKEKLLLWTRARADGGTDSLLFVPKTQETEFETLRAEDENPEGCGETGPG